MKITKAQGCLFCEEQRGWEADPDTCLSTCRSHCTPECSNMEGDPESSILSEVPGTGERIKTYKLIKFVASGN